MDTQDNGQKSLTTDQQRLVSDNVAFAMNMGRKYHGMGVSVEDLQQEACLGLCEAALRYDPSMDNTFQTYAYCYCLKYIMQAIRHHGNSLYVDDDVEQYGDSIPDDDINHQEEYSHRVQTLLNTLTDKERQVISLVYAIPFPPGGTLPPQPSRQDPLQPSLQHPLDFSQIADIMHLHPTRVKQLYANAMDKLHKNKISQ